MELNLSSLIESKRDLRSFKSKVVVIDAYNAVYQFLMDSEGRNDKTSPETRGNTTKAIVEFFYRNVNFMSIGIKPVYVFEKRRPSLKFIDITGRKQTKMASAVKCLNNISGWDVDNYIKRACKITSDMDHSVSDLRNLVKMFGIPCIDTPTESNAMLAHLTNTGQAYSSASQDFHPVLFGSKLHVMNFTDFSVPKPLNRNSRIKIKPNIIKTEEYLNKIGLTQRQLVDVGILIGTDLNPGGIKGMGQKTALTKVKKYGKLENIPHIQEKLSNLDYKHIRSVFLYPEVAAVDQITFGKIDYEGILDHMNMVGRFTNYRVKRVLDDMKKEIGRQNQDLEKWCS